MTRERRWCFGAAAGLAAVALAVAAGRAASGATSSRPQLSAVKGAVFDPGRFSHSARVDNRWLPLEPGTQYVFAGSSSDGKKRLVFTVTDLVKVVGGVRNVVVWDRDFTNGELVEAELAFFAQDDAGNVWHTGEYPEEYEGGKVVNAPAWIVGVKGAKAGFEMKATPRLGTASYAQGYAPPPVDWTDHAQIYETRGKTCVPLRCYGNVLVTREFNPDEPGRSQLKYYAPGVGNIRVGWLGKDPDREAAALVALVHLGPGALARARAAALALEARAYKTKTAVYGGTPPAERVR
jgi:hypothetical protein